MALTPSQEDVSLVFEPNRPRRVHSAQTSPEDSAVLEVVLDGLTSSLPRKEYVLPGSGLFKKVRVVQKGGDLVLRFTRLSKDPVHILPKAGGLTLTGLGKGEAAVPFKWTTSKPEAAPPADGRRRSGEVRPRGGRRSRCRRLGGDRRGREARKGLSSSRTFSLGKGGKSMILLKDSSALKEAPGPKAGTRKKLPLGEKVERHRSRRRLDQGGRIRRYRVHQGRRRRVRGRDDRGPGGEAAQGSGSGRASGGRGLGAGRSQAGEGRAGAAAKEAAAAAKAKPPLPPRLPPLPPPRKPPLPPRRPPPILPRPRKRRR